MHYAFVASARCTLEADRRVSRLAATEWSVLSQAELRACGLGAGAIRVRVRRGWLHPMHRKVYAVGHANPPREGRFLAAVKACGQGAALSHFAAAALWDLLEWDHRAIDVTVASKTAHRLRGVRVHRSKELGDADCVRRKGIPVTSVTRTLIDVAAVVDHRSLRRAIRQAIALERVDLRELMRAVARSAGRRGVRNLRKVVATSTAPTASVLEDVVLDLLIHAGFDHPDVNHPITLDGRRVVPDFRWPGVKVIVEADGQQWHDDPLARAADAERQALLEEHGEHVLRVTWDQAVRRPEQTVARLRAAGIPSAPSVRCALAADA